ncbi:MULTISPECIES: M1 family metallopeptidase [Bizionia]|uniref:M1 family metallopeptidase n=1 Tax=Bizionia algoritergicola TaxID=291187 RepID=A0A5D0QNN1_9FLAO|nr:MULTISPECIES: M1 family metallopeptidase [Bizionia]OBX22589.1 peptidase M1 [Bizionia sp. APA-3]TYB70782.1 M1 family metallopeptidase [Bizionia algoritergicola]
MKIYRLLIVFFLLPFTIFSQGLLQEKNTFTHQDTLRGSITPEREWWDLTYYHLDISVDPDTKFIKGKNTVKYTVLKPYAIIQIDLQEPLYITKVTQNGKELKASRDGNAYFIGLIDKQILGSNNAIEIHYEGHPKEAIRAPWDGGFSWKKDTNGNHFVATSCQGLGASIWWPNKDHMYDEVDSMDISITVPKGLMNVSNGRLQSIVQNKETTTYNWAVKNPINNYGVNVNIGDYVHFSEVYSGENGPLDMDYYVLRDNLEKAKTHFKDAPRMMEAFEHWFGPYPFYEDGFKLVEVPYLGMEHQSSVTYGNQYKMGYLGNDLSESGWGLKFDFIIIHEAGHEWFANNITNKDIADMWIHEGFTAYSENLFVDYFYGKEASADYVIGTRKRIQNDTPLIGTYNVNKEGSGDMYYKGANMLHTLRQLVADDEKWRNILRGLNKTFYHQTVTTKQIEDYISEKSGIDLTAFFNQYLRQSHIPNLEYSISNGSLKYRWNHVVADFDMPTQVTFNNKEQWLYPTTEWKKTTISDEKLTVDSDFYIQVSKL